MSDTPRTDALNAELYADAIKRRRSPTPVQEPYERAITLCAKLESELADATTRIKDQQDGVAAANERWIADKRELADAERKLSAKNHAIVFAPNDSGKTQCIVRWLAETPHGWIGAWDKAALENVLILDAARKS